MRFFSLIMARACYTDALSAIAEFPPESHSDPSRAVRAVRGELMREALHDCLYALLGCSSILRVRQ